MRIGNNFANSINSYTNTRNSNHKSFNLWENVSENVGSNSCRTAENNKVIDEAIGKLSEEQKKYLNDKYDINKITLYNSESTALMQDLYNMNLITKEELELYNEPIKTTMTRLPIYLGADALSGEEKTIGCLRSAETGWDEYEGLNLWEIFCKKADWGENQTEEMSAADKEYNNILTSVNQRLAGLFENIFGQNKGYTGRDYVNDAEYRNYKNALSETVQSMALAKFEKEQQYKNILHFA